jgi:hypothetical protein
MCLFGFIKAARIIIVHLHAETGQAPGHRLSDRPHADDASRPLVQARPIEFGPPATEIAAAHKLVALEHSARKPKEQRHGQLRRRFGQ